MTQQGKRIILQYVVSMISEEPKGWNDSENEEPFEKTASRRLEISGKRNDRKELIEMGWP